MAGNDVVLRFSQPAKERQNQKTASPIPISQDSGSKSDDPDRRRAE
jgi:hypothetical protein